MDLSRIEQEVYLKPVIEIQSHITRALYVCVQGDGIFNVEIAPKIPAEKGVYLKSHGEFITEIEFSTGHGVAEISL